jgi:acyl-CoA thioesterase-1
MDRRQFLAATSLAAQAAAAQQSEPAPDAFAPIKTLLAGKEPVVWLFTGDSITHGAAHTTGWRSYPEHFNERVKYELRRYRDVVLNTGISGERMPGLLKDIDWRVHRFQPTVVSLMMGMNDCGGGPAGVAAYRTNLETFHDAMKAHGSLLLLNSPNAVYAPHGETRKFLPLYVDALREFAADRKLPLVDHHKHWTETRKDFALVYLLRDGAVHPNNFGHLELAKLIFRGLGIEDPASATCRLFVP